MTTAQETPPQTLEEAHEVIGFLLSQLQGAHRELDAIAVPGLPDGYRGPYSAGQRVVILRRALEDQERKAAEARRAAAESLSDCGITFEQACRRALQALGML